MLVKLHPHPLPSSSEDLFSRPVCAKATAYLPARWIMKPTPLRRRQLGPAAFAAGPSF